MAINSHFNQLTTVSEQNLVENLIAESIQIHGQNFYYIKRTEVNSDTIFNESTLTSFTQKWLIEMYIENVDGFEGEGDFLSKFGLETRDTLDVLVSKTRFTEESSLTEPVQGDLIYFPLVDQVFEIRFVEDEVPFYQLGKQYVWKLSTELFEYSQETFNTGISEIDDINPSSGGATTVYSVDLTLGTGDGNFTVGETVYQGADLANATATAKVDSWNSGTKVLRVGTLTGTFAQNSSVIGGTSTASYLLGATATYTYIEETRDDNAGFGAVADTVVDFSVDNPFSESY